MHNSITITWENGQSNGRTIEEFDIQIAEINVFDIYDVVYAQGAYHFDVGDEIVTLPTHNTNTTTTTTRDDSAHRKKTVGVSDANNDDDNVVAAWKNVLQLNTTEGKEINYDRAHHHHHHDDDSHDDNQGKCVRKQFKGRFIGGTTFKVLGLLPGSTYIFRLKHRNDCGWSSYR